MRSKIRGTDIVVSIIIYLILIINTIVVVYPLLWNVFTSFKTNTEILENPWYLPKGLNLINYINAFTKAKIGYYSVNSVLVTVLSIIILLFLSVSSSYVLGRYKFRLNNLINNIYMCGIFIQSIFIVIPLYLMMSSLNMDDNRFWISVVYAVLQLPFSIYLLTSYMKTIPREYEDSAMIDGCGHLGTLIKIIVPLAKPGIITITIFGFFSFWNEFPLALTLLSSEEKKTLPIGLANLMEIQRYATDWGALFAGLVIVLVPTVVIYSLTQRKLTSGMQMGGIKG
ncbi:MAG TPA: carbohydrate ABC transporter permease [Clostridiaceae bacterium]|nr:carbohydrate ABC transporter permease [Clostridiaceae bacterium]